MGGDKVGGADAVRHLRALGADVETAQRRYADLRGAYTRLVADVEELRWAACAGFGALVCLRGDPGLSGASRELATATLGRIRGGQVPPPGTRHAWWAWCAAALTGVLAELADDEAVPELVRATAWDKLAAVYATRPTGEPEPPPAAVGDR